MNKVDPKLLKESKNLSDNDDKTKAILKKTEAEETKDEMKVDEDYIPSMYLLLF